MSLQISGTGRVIYSKGSYGTSLQTFHIIGELGHEGAIPGPGQNTSGGGGTGASQLQQFSALASVIKKFQLG